MSNPYYNNGNQYSTARGGVVGGDGGRGRGRDAGQAPPYGAYNSAANQVPFHPSGLRDPHRGAHQGPNSSNQTSRSGVGHWAITAAQVAFAAGSPGAAPTPPSVYLRSTPSREPTPRVERLPEFPKQVVDSEFCKIMDAMIPQYQYICSLGSPWDPADIYYLYETLHAAKSALQRGRPAGFFEPKLRSQVLGRTWNAY